MNHFLETLTIPQSRFMDIIKIIHATASPKLNPPSFIFKLCNQAASHNAKVLAEHDFDLDRIIQKLHPSQISYGSEFRDPELLEELLCHYPFWPRLRNILVKGALLPLDDISDSDREKDLIFHSNRGNHKSANKNVEMIREISAEDVARGFSLPLPIPSLHFLPNASLAPLGYVRQSTIDNFGNRSYKYQMTHDQSLPGPSS